MAPGEELGLSVILLAGDSLRLPGKARNPKDSQSRAEGSEAPASINRNQYHVVLLKVEYSLTNLFDAGTRRDCELGPH
jgi:hypothetical protein